MKPIFEPSLPLGHHHPYLAAEQALAVRIRTVLETRPGNVPWRPDFGCNLSTLVGQPATPQRLNEARWRVEESLRRWIPEVEVTHCQVNVVPLTTGAGIRDRRDLPLAETALLSLGTQAALEVLIDVETSAGVLAVQAVIEP